VEPAPGRPHPDCGRGARRGARAPARAGDLGRPDGPVSHVPGPAWRSEPDVRALRGRRAIRRRTAGSRRAADADRTHRPGLPARQRTRPGRPALPVAGRHADPGHDRGRDADALAVRRLELGPGAQRSGLPPPSLRPALAGGRPRDALPGRLQRRRRSSHLAGRPPALPRAPAGRQVARPDRRRDAPAHPARAAPASPPSSRRRPGPGHNRGGRVGLRSRPAARRGGRSHPGRRLGAPEAARRPGPGCDHHSAHRGGTHRPGQPGTRPAGRPLPATGRARTRDHRHGRRGTARAVGQRHRPAPGGPAPSGPAPSGPAPSGPAPSDPAPSDPAPGSRPERGGIHAANRDPAGHRRDPVRAGRAEHGRGRELPARGGQRHAGADRALHPPLVPRVLLVAQGQRRGLARGGHRRTIRPRGRRGRLPAAAGPAARRPAGHDRGTGDRSFGTLEPSPRGRAGPRRSRNGTLST
jgi:hypothetical protein